MAQAVLTYPKARREVVRETVGGIVLEDPYRWLEADSAESAEWGDAQNALARDYIRSWEHFDLVRERLANTGYLFWSQSYTGPMLCGNRWAYVVTRRNAYPQLGLADAPFGPPRIIFDPDALDPDTPLNLKGFQPSPDGRTVAVHLEASLPESDLGDETVSQPLPMTSQLIDVESKRFTCLQGSFLAWLPDSSGFYYLTSAGVFRQLIGEPTPTEPELAGVAGVVQVSQDGRYAALLDPSAGDNISGTAGARATFIRDQAGWQPFDPAVRGRCQGVFVADTYVAVITDGAPKGRVVSIPIATARDRSTWSEVIPEGDRVIRFLCRVHDHLVAGLADDSGIELALFGLDGTPDGTVPLAPGQIPTAFLSAQTHETIRACPGGCYFMHNEAFIALPAFYRFDFSTRSLEKTAAPVAELGQLVVTVIDTCTSEDGTKIPIRLVHRPDLDLSQPRPLLLHGYGNLDLCFYEPPAWYTPFLDAGGVYAWVTVRGGGEFGKEWWHQGSGKLKGQCSLDFCGAAEHLIELGVADRGKIACMGLSCGSIVIAGVLSRLGRQVRPDLFRAVVGIGGFYDLFTYLDVARIFSDEYGDPTDPEQAAAIATFSPYQNITDEVPYPSTLFACVDGDIGWPGHSRKLIARTQEATSHTAPILYRNFAARWHGDVGAISGENGPDSAEIAPELTAFIMRELGMTPAAPLDG